MKILLHCAVWILVFIIPTYLLYLDSSHDPTFLFRTLIQIFFYAAIFYVNYLLLAPYLFFRGQRFLFFFLSVMVVLFLTLAWDLSHHVFVYNDKPMEERFELPPPEFAPPEQRFLRPVPLKQPPPLSRNWPVYNFILTSLLISGFGLGLRFSDRLIRNEKQRQIAEKERLNTELAFLKNQINPHFFFNTLNNIYSLVQKNMQEGQQAILQLSKLMRYLLYETEKEDKLISQEIEFMRNYIELVRLRLSDKVALTVSFPDAYPDLRIPPLLFLPFLENAFKYGISYRKHSYINILMKVTRDEIYFECTNSYQNNLDQAHIESESGIGLKNVRKRLQLLFPKHHSLQIVSTQTAFSVVLVITIPRDK